MKQNRLCWKKAMTVRRMLCLALAVLVLLPAMLGCAPSGKTVMRLSEQTLSLPMYELMLSRMKGQLEYSEYPVDVEAFWDGILSTNGMTYNDYFCQSIQHEAKTVLAKLYLFEEVYHLSLTQERIDEVESLMEDILSINFSDSKTAMNQELSQYGINIDLLRENYLIEQKLDYLADHISSITGDAAREEYYNDNYICFRQILFPLYEFVYETDENGDTIYYREGSNYVCYDTKNGVTKIGTDGAPVTDADGQMVYFTDDGRIAYDTANGVKHGVDADNDGATDYVALDETMQSAITTQVQQLHELVEEGDFTTFEEYGDRLSTDDIWDSYPSGIFINCQKSYDLSYLNDIVKQLSEKADGGVALVRSEHAYHLIMKYPLTSGAYKLTANEDWFTDFEDNVCATIIEALCEPYLAQVEIDTKVLSQAKDMKTIGSNLWY